jgi:hypothetical protein
VAFASREEALLGFRGELGPALRPCGPNLPVGRVCAADGCLTRLSISNGSEYCWPHDPVQYLRVRGERIQKQAA